MEKTGIKFFEWLRGDRGKNQLIEVNCRELFEAAQEYQVRELCFWVCANMVANAMSRCEFRTFRNGLEVREKDYYLWNISPNVNQNSTMFLHKLVAKLYQDNEALIVNTLPRDDMDAIVVADSWEVPEEWPTRQNVYRGVTVGDYQYQYPIYEPDALHLRLNHTNMKSIVNGLYQSYWRMVDAAMRAYAWDRGQHWKVHVSQLAQGSDDFTAKFTAMIEEQIRPFLNSGGAVLPEFDGYAYESVSGSGSGDSRDIRAMIEDIFDFTARGFLIPAVLVNGSVEGTADANVRFLTNCIDPLCDQLQEEINRKRYGYAQWRRGTYLQVDSSSIIHFDLFANAPNVEKLVGSGAYSINEVRRAAGEAPILEPWADEHYMTLNISPMGDASRPLGAKKGVIT